MKISKKRAEQSVGEGVGDCYLLLHLLMIGAVGLGSRCTGVVGSWYSVSWRSGWAEGGTIQCQVVACSVERDEQCEAAMRIR
ncbi:uncharacterized protein G2W53_013689 [Senna tora]|uniref:Uncharacterized protein n=1 Tax=Senna tora TaxID=362788 RepID=A0A834U2N9_9FABA|nr:uncharacterized protein G2W53_013689 [Senna tora]